MGLTILSGNLTRLKKLVTILSGNFTRFKQLPNVFYHLLCTFHNRHEKIFPPPLKSSLNIYACVGDLEHLCLGQKSLQNTFPGWEYTWREAKREGIELPVP
ncbi:hypothetical protein SUGI_0404910 [Cryptomeria japonica]|nr:hypothetical protein SUGI_0404910 [Cryptomeria japonica]